MELCNRLVGGQEDCYIDIHARIDPDASLCESYEGVTHGRDNEYLRDYCYSQFGIELNDPSLCLKISNRPEALYLKENCEIVRISR